ncbi:MAG: MFS transporter [Clostridia bacterium]|nr:MFS transporter [Clostridia bacterium]
MSNKIRNADDHFTRNKWIYSLGGIGRDMSYALFTQFLLTYILFTRSVTEAQFAVISTVLIICRIWDGINDPVMGGIVENTRSRFGKFKPWIMIGCITNGAAVIAMFSNRLQGWSFVYLFIALYLIWDITYTMNDIGYWSMMPSLTSIPDRRNKIVALSNLFSGMGSLMATGLVPVFTAGSLAIGGNSITAYAAVSVFVAAMFILCQALCCAGVKENRDYKEEKQERLTLKKMFSVIFKNDQLLWSSLVTLLSYLSGAILTGFAAYYIYLEFGYNGTYVTLFTSFYAGASAVLLFVFPKLSAKFRRKKAIGYSIAVSVIGYAVFLIACLFLPVSVKFWVLCAAVMIVGFGQNWFGMTVMVIFTNTIEYNEYKTGSRDEALIFSLRPFMAKMSSALQQVVVTLVYLAIGMTVLTNSISDLEQKANLNIITEDVKLSGINAALAGAEGSMSVKLAICMAAIPIVLLIIALIILRKKDKIDEDEYERMVAEIKARKEAE